MTLDPALQTILDKASRHPPIETVPITQLRAKEMQLFGRAARPSIWSVQDHGIPGPRGALRIRVYRPNLRPGLPGVIYFHGGGFCLCSIETHDGICRQVALGADAAVVSVEYALAPEHRYPAAVADCLAAARWVCANAAAIGIDSARLALAGDSAGGALAVVTALDLAADTERAGLQALLLFYPVTDHPSVGTASYEVRGKGWGLTSDAMRWFWSQYLGSDARSDDPRASLLRTNTFASLPPTYVATAEYDPLRDEGAELVTRLGRDGVLVTWRHHDDLNHAFLGWAGVIGPCTAALQDATAWLRVGLHRGLPGAVTGSA